MDRRQKIEEIKKTIREEMDKPAVDVSPYKIFIETLSGSTVNPWRHLFITTNWDYLLQREILNFKLKMVPRWLRDSHVFHINGTAEVLEDNSNRSFLVLEDDPPEKRVSTLEANLAFDQMIWGQLFVVVGMSFECQIDKFLLTALNRVQDDLPIGESKWLIVNSNEDVLTQSAERIRNALPRGMIVKVKKKFELWVNNNMPELQEEGVFAF